MQTHKKQYNTKKTNKQTQKQKLPTHKTINTQQQPKIKCKNT